MIAYRFKLLKVKSCVYEVWSVDERGIFDCPIGEVGMYSELCKYDRFYSDFPELLGVGDSQWLFFSFYYDCCVFDDYISALSYIQSLGSGA